MHELEKEIERIRHELSVTLPEELQNSMYSGDVLESSEYSEILNRQNILSIRLMQLTQRLYYTQTLDVHKISKTRVGLGSLVKLLCTRTNTEYTVKLIASEMSDTSVYDEITLQSPMGKAVYNKQLNDIITAQTPSGIRQYKIISLQTIHDIKHST